MKIAQVCPRYYPYIGGVETHAREISERLVEKGFEVEVLTTDPGERFPREEAINGVEVQRFRSWAPGEAYYFSVGLKRFLMENSERYDIIHAHSYHALSTLYAAQAKGRNKFVFTPHYHGKGHTFFRNLLHIPWKFTARKIFKRADKIVCVSSYEKNLVTDNFKVEEEKISVIPNGLALEEFEGLRKRKKDNKVILYVGRLEKYKGIHYLVRCLPKLGVNFRLEIVGKGPYENDLIKAVNRMEVQDRVRFYQDLSRKKLLQKYAEADLFISLSKHEAFGICVAEALAAKTPCIVARTSALKEFIDHRNCFGINYPVNVNELVELVNNVVHKEVSDVELPEWNDVVRRLIAIYHSV